jgi:hypothetical protein
MLKSDIKHWIRICINPWLLCQQLSYYSYTRIIKTNPTGLKLSREVLILCVDLRHP